MSFDLQLFTTPLVSLLSLYYLVFQSLGFTLFWGLFRVQRFSERAKLLTQKFQQSYITPRLRLSLEKKMLRSSSPTVSLLRIINLLNGSRYLPLYVDSSLLCNRQDFYHGRFWVDTCCKGYSTNATLLIG